MVNLQTAIAEDESEIDKPYDALPGVEDLAHCEKYLLTDESRLDSQTTN